MMGWVVVAAVGVVVAFTVAFWQQIVTWANQTLAGWLAERFGPELRDVFLLILAGADRSVVISQRAASLIQDRLVSARVLFQQLQGGQTTQKIVVAEIKQDDGEVVMLQAAELVPWHELPDDVREKFIRRQSPSVELTLKK
jgi:hypothetical protein